MFSDIESYWAKECIATLRERSLVKGYSDGKFRPESPLTRAEFASLMVGAFGNSPEVQKAVAFKDVPRNHWAWQFIQTVSKKKFFSGYPDGTFRPEQPILRVDAITVIASALDLPFPQSPEATLKDAFDDAAEIPNYAKNVMASATQGAIVVNYPNVRKLRPNQNATRGEVAALLCRALRIYTVTPEYIAVSIAGTARPRSIFNLTPGIIETYFGVPIYEAGAAIHYASTALERLCRSTYPKNIRFMVGFLGQPSGKPSLSGQVFLDPVRDEGNRGEIDIKQVFEYVFGYPLPVDKDLSKASWKDYEGFRHYSKYDLGDGVLVSWDDNPQFGMTNIYIHPAYRG